MIPDRPAVSDVATRAGMTQQRRRWGPCPACSSSRTSDGRPPIRIFRGDTAWWCNACDAHGDSIHLASFHRLGRRDAGADFRAVLTWARTGAVAPPAEPREPQRAPRAELAAVLRRARRPNAVADVAAWLRDERHLDPARVPAAVLPPDFSASWWPAPWSATWRLVVPAFTGRGELASFQARAIPTPRDEPKTRWPWRLDASGLLFAEPAYARPLLRGATITAPDALLIVEGLTDYLAAASHAREEGLRLAVIGVASGSFAALRLLELPAGLPIYLATDPDLQGNSYAGEVLESYFAPRHLCRRVPLELLERRVA